MPSSRFAYTIALALVMLLAMSAGSYAVNIGDKAPDFTLDSIKDSGQITLSDYYDKPTVLVFWASWCPHCRVELPTLQRLYDEYGDHGAHFVGVDLDSTKAEGMAFVKDKGIEFPVAYGGSQEGHNSVALYGIYGIPAVYVLDKGGIVKYKYAGETDEGTIKENLASLGVK